MLESSIENLVLSLPLLLSSISASLIELGDPGVTASRLYSCCIVISISVFFFNDYKI